MRNPSYLFQFGGVEAFVTFLVDLRPKLFRKGYRREMLIGAVCVASFLIGLSMICEVSAPILSKLFNDLLQRSQDS